MYVFGNHNVSCDVENTALTSLTNQYTGPETFYTFSCCHVKYGERCNETFENTTTPVNLSPRSANLHLIFGHVRALCLSTSECFHA